MTTDHIEVLTQSCIRIQSQLGTIYLDPFRMPDAPHDAAYILITHDHHDHFSPEDIAKVSSETTVLIVPEPMRHQADAYAHLVQRIETVRPNESRDVDGLHFETIPSYNEHKAFHPKNAGWVGYLLHVDGTRIYVAGDTDATQEARAVTCDVALIPIGGTYTMDPAQAADLVNAIRPAVAIPTHYGSIVGRPEDQETFAAQVNPPTRVEYKIPF